jgi:hypothetical protein
MLSALGKVSTSSKLLGQLYMTGSNWTQDRAERSSDYAVEIKSRGKPSMPGC